MTRAKPTEQEAKGQEPLEQRWGKLFPDTRERRKV